MNDFDAAMLDRLRASSTEASRVVLDLVKGGRKMPDAVADAVETLPWSETVALRRWTENWEAFLEWQRFEAMGWKIAKTTRRRVLVDVPSNKWRELAHRWIRLGYGEMRRTAATLMREGDIPSEAAVAAAGDVGLVANPLMVDGGDVRWPYAIRYLAYDVKRQK